MSLLLDTHVWLWWTQGAERKIPGPVQQRIAQGEERIALSIASLWEIAIKSSIGKLSFPSSPATYVLRQMKRQRFELLDVRVEHVDAVATLPRHHRDPFDRMLVAQARVEGLTILTADEVFSSYEVPTIIF